MSETPVPATEHKGGSTRRLSRAGPRAPRALGRGREQPRLPRAGPGLVATPPPGRPPRIRLRSDTRSACPTPGHVSRSPGGRSLSTKQRGRGMSRSPPGPAQARQAAGPRAEAAVTKRLLCRPARPSAVAETAPARRAGPAAPPPLPRARPGLGSRGLPRPTATPRFPSSASPQSAATGRSQDRSPVPSCLGPTKTRPGRRGAPGSEQRR